MKRAILFLAACAPDAPSTPSYQQHVAPILAANCVRCHGVPVLGGAPAGFRLDAFHDYGEVAGAATYSQAVALRTVDDERPMPPRFGLDDYQIETLANWDAAGAPRGEPNPGNRAPTAEITDVLKSIEEDGLEVRVRYLIDIVVRDPDPDVVGGALFATLGARTFALGPLRSGPNRVAWDTTDEPRATFSLQVKLDDGGAEITAPLGTLDVEGP